MRIFHRLAFEGYIQTTGTNEYSLAPLSELMGQVDMIHVGGYASQVTGTSPVLFVDSQYSADNQNWVSSGFAIVNAWPLSTSQETLFQGNDMYFQNQPRMPFMRLVIILGGTNPAGYFRIWVTGRDQSRRAKSIMQQVTDVVDLAPPQAM